MMNVAITGSTGLIGSRLLELLETDFSFIPLSSSDLNITNRDAVRNKLADLPYDTFLHLAGYTNVNEAEKDHDKVYALNVKATSNLYEIVTEQRKKFIYISTDYVFDGAHPPYYEDSKPNPIGYYGQTKYEGEMIVKDSAMIIRPSFPYRKEFAKKKDFMRTIKTLLEEKKQLKMVTDSLITPTFIDDFAYALKHLMNNFSPEIFHIVGASSMSPYDAGKLIARTYGLDEALIEPTTYADYFKGKALPPQYSEIKSNKNIFYKMSAFEEGLKKIM
ncbi:MAG: hypothetical protein RI947_1310 [Candidatus Parcubacteria bacterium]